MKIVILCDIHGNLPALEAVMREVRHNISPDAVFFGGDVVGYGPWPGETIDMVRDVMTAGVLGNHDAGVIGKVDATDYYDAVRYVINWTQSQLNRKQMEFLDSLKYIHVEEHFGNFLLSHGSPLNPSKYDYIFNCKGVSRLFEVEKFLKHINFIGHSHYLNLFLLTGDNKTIELSLDTGEVNIASVMGYSLICVCGSVGQPRDGDPRASFISFDTETKLLRVHRVEYNIEQTVQKIKSLRLPVSFGERLLHGT